MHIDVTVNLSDDPHETATDTVEGSMSQLRAKYTVWSYLCPKPGTNPRRRWRGDADMVTEWAYALASPCGTYFETSRPVSGFATEAEAVAAARARLGQL